MRQFSLEFNRNYGVDHRSGWSVKYDWHVVVQFERWAVVALAKAWWRWRQWS